MCCLARASTSEGLARRSVTRAPPDAPIIGEDPRAPVEVDDQLLCESCLAVVDYTMTELKKKVPSVTQAATL